MCADCVLLKQISPFVGVPRGSSRFSQHTSIYARAHTRTMPMSRCSHTMLPRNGMRMDGCSLAPSMNRLFGQPKFTERARNTQSLSNTQKRMGRTLVLVKTALFHFHPSLTVLCPSRGPRRCQIQMTSATAAMTVSFPRSFPPPSLLSSFSLFPFLASSSPGRSGRPSSPSSFPDCPPPPLQFAFLPCHPQIWSRQNQTFVTGDMGAEAAEPRMEQISE